MFHFVVKSYNKIPLYFDLLKSSLFSYPLLKCYMYVVLSNKTRLVTMNNKFCPLILELSACSRVYITIGAIGGNGGQVYQ